MKGRVNMPLPKNQLYTIDDIYNLPDGIRAELIDGQIYNMAPPGRTHQDIAGELFTIVKNHIKANNGSCKPYIAPFAVFLNDDDTTYVEPDISVICKPEKLNDKGCVGAPDWIIEIVSPGSRRIDYYVKLFKYRSADVREYWIVDPEKKLLTVHYFEDEKSPYQYSFTDVVKVNIFESLLIDFQVAMQAINL